MDDLISRKALLAAYDERHKGPPGGARELIEDAPSVPAVPLDKLCELLSSWDDVIPCHVCKSVFHLESCPHGPFDCGDSEHLKMLIKKWMEELDAAD